MQIWSQKRNKVKNNPDLIEAAAPSVIKGVFVISPFVQDVWTAKEVKRTVV
jgi:hypothetical protein